jgi:hypothetical protein
MSNKKYRLLKDLPDAKVGTIFSYTEDGYYTAETPGEDGICGKWPPHYVQSNSEWFKEEAPARIEVSNLEVLKSTPRGYSFDTSRAISKDLFPAISRAIEAVVNGEKEFVVTTDGTNDESPKIYVSGIEYAPKGFWTDELVKEFIHIAFAPCDPNHPFMENRMKEFKEMKPKQQNP